MINLISSSPLEQEQYNMSSELRTVCDTVSHLISDLHTDDNDFKLDIIVSINDMDNPDCFSLAFSGTTLALDFYPDKIDVTDFDASDGDSDEVIQSFQSNEVSKATLWLVNKADE